jgi:Cytochrome c7 and related cytochrome c
MRRLKDAEHLVRLALVFVIGTAAFVVVRAILVPRSFGEYGHYRGNAIAEIAAQPVKFAGQATCEGCHADVAGVKSKGMHVSVNCEACHGALANHADDPTSVLPAKLDTAILCIRCHEVNGARPQNFPQIVAKDHSAGLSCEACHPPHSPLIQTGGAKP